MNASQLRSSGRGGHRTLVCVAAPIAVCLVTAFALIGYSWSRPTALLHPPEQRPPTASASPQGAAVPVRHGPGHHFESSHGGGFGHRHLRRVAQQRHRRVFPPPRQQEKLTGTWWRTTSTANGGAGCRKIVMSFYDVNPVDAATAQQTCLSIAASHPYIVLDSGALTDVGASSCIPQHQIPLASRI